jgi:hypothetical protein
VNVIEGALNLVGRLLTAFLILAAACAVAYILAWCLFWHAMGW